jgi:predicted nucleic acid-binding protein
LDRIEPYHSPVEQCLAILEANRGEACASVVTELEMLVKPFRLGYQRQAERIVEYLSEAPWSVLPVSRQIARQAAATRAATNLRVADALIVATALVSGCDALVGNDALCAQRVNEIRYIYLEDHVPL